MNIDALCAAVWEAERWMKQFNRKEYPGAFRRYGEKFAPLYVQAVQEAEDLEGLQALADDMLDALERRWKRRWLGRGALMVDENDDILLIESGGVVIRTPVESVSKMGRDARGVIVMRIEPGKRVIAIQRTDPAEEEIPENSEAEESNSEASEE